MQKVHITKSKTRPRTLPLIFSIPYVKDWIDSHPFTNNPDAFLFVSLADRNIGERLTWDWTIEEMVAIKRAI